MKNSKQQSAFENFARQVALAISAVLKNNITLIEQLTNTMEPNPNIEIVRSSVQQGLKYMVQLSNIDEDELFKICLEFWHWFCNDAMMKTKGAQLF